MVYDLMSGLGLCFEVSLDGRKVQRSAMFGASICGSLQREKAACPRSLDSKNNLITASKYWSFNQKPEVTGLMHGGRLSI
jgi:hypothetical protein